MRQMIYEVLGAESGATMTEYGMFANACANSAAFVVALFGTGSKSKIESVAGRSNISLNSTRKLGT